MKKLLVLLVLVVGAWVAYNYTATGKFTLLPAGPLTPEEEELQRMERAFESAAQEFNQALRSAGLAGLDTTGDADAAMQEVQRIERSLEKLMRGLNGEEVRGKAEQLKSRIREFKRKAGA